MPTLIEMQKNKEVQIFSNKIEKSREMTKPWSNKSLERK